MFLLAAVLGLFAYDNKEFLNTVKEQRQDGYYWTQIDCRQVTEGVSAITINTPTGKSLVCNKLVK